MNFHKHAVETQSGKENRNATPKFISTHCDFVLKVKLVKLIVLKRGHFIGMAGCKQCSALEMT